MYLPFVWAFCTSGGVGEFRLVLWVLILRANMHGIDSVVWQEGNCPPFLIGKFPSSGRRIRDWCRYCSYSSDVLSRILAGSYCHDSLWWNTALASLGLGRGAVPSRCSGRIVGSPGRHYRVPWLSQGGRRIHGCGFYSLVGYASYVHRILTPKNKPKPKV